MLNKGLFNSSFVELYQWILQLLKFSEGGGLDWTGQKGLFRIKFTFDLKICNGYNILKKRDIAQTS